MKHFILGTAGHVDHGKTALVKALTGIELDTHKEEQRRGITINNGFTNITLPDGREVGVIDVPGHQDLIRNMIAGATGMDVVLLVIDANKGAQEQTLEHLQVLEILGVSKVIVALTKTDLLDEEERELSIEILREFIDETSLKDAAVIPVSAHTGEGLPELLQEISNALQEIQLESGEKGFKMWVDRYFSIKGHGTVLTGTVHSGEYSVGEDAWLYPGKRPVKVRSIQRHGQVAEQVVAGDRTAINIPGLSLDSLKRGMLLSNLELKESLLADASFRLFQDRYIRKRFFHALFFAGTAEVPVKVHLLDCETLEENQDASIQIYFSEPIAIHHGDHYVLRSSSNDRTLGGGIILDAAPLHHRRRKQAAVNAVDTVKQKGISGLIALKVAESASFLTLDELTALLNIAEVDVTAVLDKGVKGVRIVKHAKTYWVCLNSYLNGLSKNILKEVRWFQETELLRVSGVTVEELQGRLGQSLRRPPEKMMLQNMMGSLVTQQKLKVAGNGWFSVDFESLNNKSVVNLIDTVTNWYENHGNNTYSARLLSDELGLAPEDELFKKVLIYLMRNGILMRVENTYILNAVIDLSRKTILQYLQDGHDDLTVAKLRDLLQANRQTALSAFAIVEKEGLIYRSGDVRLLSSKGKQQLKDLQLQD